MQISLLYITVEDKSAALELADALLGEKLIACANILPPMTSIFRWEGQMQQESEVAMIAKTTADRQEAAMARIAELHGYDTPCIVALPAAAVHTPFAEWIFSATRD